MMIEISCIKMCQKTFVVPIEKIIMLMDSKSLNTKVRLNRRASRLYDY